MPTDKRYTPHSAAQVVGIGVSTVRLWCREYAEFLSPLAAPAQAGTARTLLESDVATLQLVKELREREKLDTAGVRERLRQIPAVERQHPYIESPTAAPAPASESPQDAAPPRPAAQLPVLRADVSAAVDERLATILERQESMGKDIASMRSERHGALMLAAGVGIGVIVMLVAIGLVAWLTALR